MGSNKQLVNVFDLRWRPELAYVVGLVAADGWLRKDTKEIGLTSKDRQLIDIFQELLGLDKIVIRVGRGGQTRKPYWAVRFKSKQLHSFLIDIGVTPAKSKTIQRVEIPDAYFGDFLRGLFDGDGTFWTWWDKRWPNSFGYTLGISSASIVFINWLQDRLADLYNTKGYVHKGAGVFTLRYVKGDSRTLFAVMYYGDNLLFLERKYRKIKTALDFDAKIKQKKEH